MLAKQRSLAMGKRIRLAREAANLSRIILGASLSPPVGSTSIYRYETGKRPPTLEQIECIALLTGTSSDWLLTGMGPSLLAGAAA